MRTMLINPPAFNPGKYRRILEERPIPTYTMPLGIGYIAAVLEKEDREVKALDAYKMSWEELEKSVKDYSPDILGISCLTDQRGSVYRAIRMAKEVDKKIKIVLGGAHATFMFEQILNNFPVDIVVLGEGENTFLQLLRTWEKDGNLAEIKGIAFSNNGKVIKTENAGHIENLDTIPFPAYHFFDFDMYSGWELHEQIGKILGDKNFSEYRNAAIVTSRGCPWNCSFCSVSPMWGRKWRCRSAKNVVDEVEMVINNYNCKVIDFVDDIFSTDQGRVIEICEEIIKRKLKISWGFETGVKFVSEEMLKKAAEAGCVCIMYGVESASKGVMENVSRKTEVESIINAFQLTKKAGIITGAFIMVGNPGENEKTINETLKILRIIKPDILVNQILMVFAGTEQYERAKKEAFMDDQYWLSELPAPYYEQHHNLRKLIRLHKKIEYYNMNRLNILLRTLCDAVEINVGIRITKRGICKGWKIPSESLWRTDPPKELK